MPGPDREEVLEHAGLHGAAAAAERYDISPGTIRSWKHRQGTDATAEPEVEPGPPEWPVVSIAVPSGDPTQGVPFGSDGVARIPTTTVRARRMPAGDGRTIVSLTDATHLRVPVADAEQIRDGDIIAAGSIGLRIVSRRRADLDREGTPLTVDAQTRARLEKFMLLRVEPAHLDDPRRNAA